MLLTYIAIGIGLFFAMNIGASGAAATMGPAYGSGAVKRKWIALCIAAVGVFLGAVIGSSEVVNTISKGIIPAEILTVQIVVVILGSATVTLFIANLMGIPLSTSEVTIGSIVGVGVAFQALFVNNILYIVMFWMIFPVVAFGIAIVLGKLIVWIERKFPMLREGGKWQGLLVVLIIITGFIEAFSAGMNNVANAVGPLIGAGIMEQSFGIWIGAAFVALGALLLGRRVLETNGKKITRLSLLQGSAISGTGGVLVIIASIFGLPVPLTQITTSAILGIGTVENGFRLWQKNIIAQIIKVWIVSPVLALVVSYTLVNLVIDPNLYTVTIVIGVLIATIGVISLYQTVAKERRSTHDSGGGI